MGIKYLANKSLLNISFTILVGHKRHHIGGASLVTAFHCVLANHTRTGGNRRNAN
jgi:hypothetical protein